MSFSVEPSPNSPHITINLDSKIKTRLEEDGSMVVPVSLTMDTFESPSFAIFKGVPLSVTVHFNEKSRSFELTALPGAPAALRLVPGQKEVVLELACFSHFRWVK